MIVTCPSCSARFQYDEARFEGLKTKRFRCPKCQEVFEVENPHFVRTTTNVIDEKVILAAMEGDSAPTASPRQPSYPDGDRPLDGDTTARHDREGMLTNAGVSELGIPPGMRFTIAFLSGPMASMVKVLDSPRIVIGREDGDIITHDPETSRRHAVLEIHLDGTVWLRDLGSTNGTFVDAARIPGPVPLCDRQEFTCGKSTFMMLIRKEENAHLE